MAPTVDVHRVRRWSGSQAASPYTGGPRRRSFRSKHRNNFAGPLTDRASPQYDSSPGGIVARTNRPDKTPISGSCPISDVSRRCPRSPRCAVWFFPPCAPRDDASRPERRRRRWHAIDLTNHLLGRNTGHAGSDGRGDETRICPDDAVLPGRWDGGQPLDWVRSRVSLGSLCAWFGLDTVCPGHRGDRRPPGLTSNVPTIAPSFAQPATISYTQPSFAPQPIYAYATTVAPRLINGVANPVHGATPYADGRVRNYYEYGSGRKLPEFKPWLPAAPGGS